MRFVGIVLSIAAFVCVITALSPEARVRGAFGGGKLDFVPMSPISRVLLLVLAAILFVLAMKNKLGW